MFSIELDQISKSYTEANSSHTVLHNLDLKIEEGEWVVLLGKSGSGKSTLLNIIAGLDQPDTGTVKIGTHEVNTFSEKESTLFRRKHIGFVFQFFNLIPTLTVEENCMLPLELINIPLPEARGRVQDLLHQVGLSTKARSFPDQLSGGEQQRVAIVRALVHEPQMIIADEPTGNLDEEISETVLDVFQSLVKARGYTMIMATHSQNVADRADRVFRLKEGRIVETNTEIS